MATLSDILISKDEYVNVSLISGISLETAVDIFNKSTSPIRLQVQNIQPSPTSEDGEILFVGPNKTSIRESLAPDDSLWAKSIGATVGILSLIPSQISPVDPIDEFTLNRTILCTLQSIEKQLKLLNLNVEEAWETHLTEDDL